jgi:hypothetical protein
MIYLLGNYITFYHSECRQYWCLTVPQRNDVISSVDGLAISNDGRVRRDGMSPLDFRVMFSLKLVGESISLVVCVDLFLKCYCA